MALRKPQTVAVIGSGMTGISCASALSKAKLAVTVFDKGRGSGGRLATRRVDGFSFDHGAQYITARGKLFRDWVFSAQTGRHAANWNPVVEGEITHEPRDWFCGVPGMSAIINNEAASLTIIQNTTVARLERRAPGWFVKAREGVDPGGPFDTVVMTVPSPQAVNLTSEFGRAFEAIRDVVMAPCWAVMIGYAKRVEVPFDVVRSGDIPIAWAARNSSKTGRDTNGDGWVIHASPDWSRNNLEMEPQAAAAALHAELQAAHPAFREHEPAYLGGHRWRYALTEKPLGVPCIHDMDLGLVAAGDWCLGARVESAFDSGLAAAYALCGRIDAPL